MRSRISSPPTTFSKAQQRNQGLQGKFRIGWLAVWQGARTHNCVISSVSSEILDELRSICTRLFAWCVATNLRNTIALFLLFTHENYRCGYSINNINNRKILIFFNTFLIPFDNFNLCVRCFVVTLRARSRVPLCQPWRKTLTAMEAHAEKMETRAYHLFPVHLDIFSTPLTSSCSNCPHRRHRRSVATFCSRRCGAAERC